jgi:hypothetical protein
MPILNRLFGRGGGPRLDLAALQAHLGEAVARSTGARPDADLIRARFADRCRDAELQPLLPSEFDALAGALDGESWGRLALLVGTLDLDAVRETLSALVAPGALRHVVNVAFVGVVRDTALLTRELLHQSPLRVEELARRFIAALGAEVRGESEQVSRERLRRLDYGRLLAEAERAKQAAEGRVEEIHRLLDEREKKFPRRGKW